MNKAAEPPLSRAAIIVSFIIFTGIWGSTWIVIRDQLGVVAPQWSVAYRFLIAAGAMIAVARWQGASLRLPRGAGKIALLFGVSQFAINFNAVYLAERHITSGLVATVFALLLIPNALLAWAWLGDRPNRRFIWSSIPALAGIVLLFVHETRADPSGAADVLAGIGLTLAGLISASFANVLQATPAAKRVALPTMLAWGMTIGAVIDVAVALVVAGPPTFDPRPGYVAGLLYLAFAASALAFSLYIPVVRAIGPARAAYSSVLVPIIAMALSTLFEGYRWSPLAALGAALAIGGMVLAIGGRPKVQPLPPD
jgi:drug/metabolite transporter (DMT)-like permease